MLVLLTLGPLTALDLLPYRKFRACQLPLFHWHNCHSTSLCWSIFFNDFFLHSFPMIFNSMHWFLITMFSTCAEILRVSGMLSNQGFGDFDRLRHRSPSPMASSNLMSNVSGTGLGGWNSLQQEVTAIKLLILASGLYILKLLLYYLSILFVRFDAQFVFVMI